MVSDDGGAEEAQEVQLPMQEPRHDGPLTLLCLSSSRDRGGAEGYMVTIARAALRHGWRAHVALPSVPETRSVINDLGEAGVQTHDIDLREYPRGRWGLLTTLPVDLVNMLKSLALLRRVRPDVVHITLPWPDFCLGSQLACAFAGVRFVVVFQLVPPHFRLPAWRRILYRWVHRRAAAWVAISGNNRRIVAEACGVDEQSLSMVYNGAPLPSPRDEAWRERRRHELRAEFGFPQRAKVLITVGRLDGQKGYPVLIPCIESVVRRHPDVKFLWIGDGVEREAIEELLRAEGVGKHVVLAGHRDDAPEMVVGADLFVFPTLYEGGQSFAIGEAMAAGLPIVSSNASGIPEIIEHGVHGLLFPVEDSDALLERLLEALDDPARMAAMAERARERVKDFSEDEMVRRTLQVLEVAATGGPSHPE